MNDANSFLADLIREPNESLNVEVKEWLDLSDNDHRATIAKEIIALANHGGGFLVVGFEEQSDGSFKAGSARPSNLEAWSQDGIQSIVAKYLDPSIQCRVVHQSDGIAGEKYPIIVVPGGHRMPVRAKAGSPDGKKLVTHRVYVRRPGPASEEPRTAEEWDRLLDRCVKSRQEELLDAMRSIMAGVIPGSVAATSVAKVDRLTQFQSDCAARWEKLAATLPVGTPPTLPNGYYDFAFAIDGDFDRQTLSQLRDTMRTAVRNHSGWPPFVNLSRDPYRPKVVDGTVECWVGQDTDGSYDVPAHHDFWRASPDGMFFLRRGYPEDGRWKGVEPGTSLDITTPTWRIGEAILEARYIGEALHATSANLIIAASWTKLSGRSLVSHGNPNRIMFDGYKSAQDSYSVRESIAVTALPDALPELVFAMLAPLYELFDFFTLPKRLVEEELATLRRNSFAT